MDADRLTEVPSARVAEQVLLGARRRVLAVGLAAGLAPGSAMGAELRASPATCHPPINATRLKERHGKAGARGLPPGPAFPVLAARPRIARAYTIALTTITATPSAIWTSRVNPGG